MLIDATLTLLGGRGRVSQVHIVSQCHRSPFPNGTSFTAHVRLRRFLDHNPGLVRGPYSYGPSWWRLTSNGLFNMIAKPLEKHVGVGETFQKV